MKKSFLKITAAALLFAFAFQEIAHATPFESQSSAGVSPATLDQILKNPSQLEVPTQFAIVKEHFTGTNGRLVVHVQDAHANFDAQKNLASTLQVLSGRYRIPL